MKNGLTVLTSLVPTQFRSTVSVIVKSIANMLCIFAYFMNFTHMVILNLVFSLYMNFMDKIELVNLIDIFYDLKGYPYSFYLIETTF